MDQAGMRPPDLWPSGPHTLLCGVEKHLEH
jgi:hypothetical protein